MQSEEELKDVEFEQKLKLVGENIQIGQMSDCRLIESQ